MREKLIANGQFIVDPEYLPDLRALVGLLRSEGHAVGLSEEYINEKLVSATAYHYLSCEKCKKLPSAADLGVTEGEKGL